MRNLMSWIVRHPVLAVTLALVSTLGFVPGLADLRIDSSTQGLMARGDANVRFYNDLKGVFADDVILSLVLTSDDIFQRHILESVERLTYEGGGIDGVSRVVSLTTVSNLKGEEGVLLVDDLLAEISTDPAALARVRADALANELLLGEVVSRDGRATAVHLFLENRPQESGLEHRVVTEAETLLAAERARLGDRVEMYQVGSPYLTMQVMDHIRSGVSTLLPVSIAALLLILSAFFRSPVASILPVVTGLLSVVATLGLMGFLGFAFNPVTMILPTLLMVIGCTEDIHLLAEYEMGLRNRLDKHMAVSDMATKSGIAILLTSATTFVGFVTLAPNHLPMLSQFGIASSFGIAFNFLVTVLMVPSLLRLLPAPRAFRGNAPDTLVWVRRVILTAALRYRWLVVTVSFLLVVFAVLGIARMIVDTNYLNFFRQESEVRRLYRKVSNDLVGAQSFLVVIDTGQEEGIQEARVLKDVATLSDFLAKRFDKVLGYADFIRKLNQEMHDGDPHYWVVPDSSALISQYSLLLDPDDVERFVDADFARTAILVRTAESGSREIRRMVREIEAFARTHISRDLDVRVMGKAVLIAQASDTISRELIISIVFVFVAIFVFISLLFFSVKAGLLATIPNVIPVLFNFGIMGWFGIPLSSATFPVAIIALGIAVDDTIHFMARFSHEIKTTSDNEVALSTTLNRELRPILTTSVALAVNFAVLTIGQLVSTMQFGMLASITMISALLSDLFVTPVLLRTTPLITTWDLLRLKISDRVLEESPLFRGLSRGEVKRVGLLGALKNFAPGERVIQQDELGNDLVVLLRGTARIEAEDAVSKRSRELGTVEEGGVVGEIAFFIQERRSANVIALDAVETLQIDGPRLLRIQARFPRIAAKVYYNLSQLLSTRLTKTTHQLIDDLSHEQGADEV